MPHRLAAASPRILAISARSLLPLGWVNLSPTSSTLAERLTLGATTACVWGRDRCFRFSVTVCRGLCLIAARRHCALPRNDEHNPHLSRRQLPVGRRWIGSLGSRRATGLHHACRGKRGRATAVEPNGQIAC